MNPNNYPPSFVHSKLVLLVEDNKQLNAINRRALALEGYEVCTAHTLAEAREHLLNRAPDAIVLDILLPDGSGLDFCQEIRANTTAPILFLTSVKGYEKTLEGLRAGGDDYLNKPFDIDLLLAKVGAFLRRDEIAKRIVKPPRMFTRWPLALDILAHRAYLNDEDMQLPRLDFALLYHLAQNEGEILMSEFLYKDVWKMPTNHDTSAVKNAVYRLRKKLEGSGFTIVTLRGKGYRFERE